MNVHVLLNLLLLLRKTIKCKSYRNFLSLFPNLFIKFNNTGAQMLNSVLYHMTQLFCDQVLGVKTSRVCHTCDAAMDVISKLYQHLLAPTPGRCLSIFI